MTGTIFLGTAELSVRETDGTAYVPIVRTGDLSGRVVVQYGITSDTAEDGDDYVGHSGSVTMDPGEDRVLVPVQIINDRASEDTEKFVLSIINVDSGTIRAPRTTRIDILDDESPSTDPPEPPLVSDYNVTESVVFGGLENPISFEFAPHDPLLVYVAEKDGVIKVCDLDTGNVVGDFIDISDQVNSWQDRGLMDIALHPDFPEQPYVYAFYVVDPPDTAGRRGNAGPDGAGNRFSYVVRFTADESTGFTTAVEGSEVVLAGGDGQSLSDISGRGAIDSTSDTSIIASDIADNSDPDDPVYKQDYIKVDSGSHAGGSLAFGPDGALYVSTGDGTSYDMVDPRTVSVQDTDSLSGKILRIDPITGEGLPDNPFGEPGDDLDSNQSKVFQLGLRNPFSMGFDDNGQLFISDTGWTTYEEINAGPPGANFGWPFFEGADNGVLRKTGGYRDLPEAAAFYEAVEAGDIEVTPAFRAFAHASRFPGFQVQAITGGDTTYSGSQYPSEFLGDYFFTDYSQGEVYTIDLNDRRQVTYLYTTTNGYGPVHFSQGPDGYIYYADIVRGEIGRLQISADGAVSVHAGTAGAETMRGGSGDDTYIVDHDLDVVVENPGEGRDTVKATRSHELEANVETLVLDGTARIAGTGNGLSNEITGNHSANVLSGGGGRDALHGGYGRDRLYGDAAVDALYGGAGNDILSGGPGRDRFILPVAGDSLPGGGGDRILDFQPGVDKLDLSPIDTDPRAGDQGFVWRGTWGFSGADDEVRYRVVNRNAFVYGDMDGDKWADLEIRLDGVSSLSASDVLL